MSPWEAPVPIFEDEDEAALISEFVKFSAAYPKHNVFQICAHVFRDKREPTRANQAAMVWPNDLAILERIRIARLNGGKEPSAPETKEDKLKKLEAMYDCGDYDIKDRIAAMRLHSELQGEIVKAIDKKVTGDNQPRRHLQIVQAVYPSAA